MVLLHQKTNIVEILNVHRISTIMFLPDCFLLKTAIAVPLKKSIKRKSVVFLRGTCLRPVFFCHTAAAANSLSESRQVPGGKRAAIRSSSSFQIDFFSFFTGGSNSTPVISFSLAKRLM